MDHPDFIVCSLMENSFGLKNVKVGMFYISPLSDIRMLYIKYLTMYKAHMHASAIRKLFYGCAKARDTITYT